MSTAKAPAAPSGRICEKVHADNNDDNDGHSLIARVTLTH